LHLSRPNITKRYWLPQKYRTANALKIRQPARIRRRTLSCGNSHPTGHADDRDCRTDRSCSCGELRIIELSLSTGSVTYGGSTLSRRSRAFSLLGIAGLCCGCAVGPSYQPPRLPAIAAYTREVPALNAAIATAAPASPQRLRLGADLPGQWWTLFGSARVNALIEQGLKNYPDIAAQQAALRAALEEVRAEAGVFYPALQGTVGATREKISGASIGPGFPGFISNIFQANVNVSYAFDLFGGERRALQQLRAQALAQNFTLEASYLTLTSNIAATAIQIASVRDQIATTRELVAIEGKQLEFIQRRLAFGSQTRDDVLLQESNLAAVRATLPALQQQLAVAEHRMTILVGGAPPTGVRFEFALADFTLPRELPLSLPASLVAQRPDIQAQEALVRAAGAAVGVATANLLPRLTLTGAYGGESPKFANLLAPGSNTWSLFAGVTQPLFEGGTLRARRRAAIDVFHQARAAYRLTVLQAFQNVADTLTALDNDAQALAAESTAVAASKASLDLVQRQYRDGAVNDLALLAAEQLYQQARIADVKTIANRFTDTVTLFQALGGGWWQRSDAGTLIPRQREDGNNAEHGP